MTTAVSENHLSTMTSRWRGEPRKSGTATSANGGNNRVRKKPDHESIAEKCTHLMQQSKRARMVWASLLLCLVWHAFHQNQEDPFTRGVTSMDISVNHQRQASSSISRLRKEKQDKQELNRHLEDSPTSLFSDKDTKEALAFVLDRKRAYDAKKRLPQWPLRGVGYLYQHYNMTLAAKLTQKPILGRNVLAIHNLQSSPSSSSFDCQRLTIWVRVNGPEIHAGSAKPIASNSSKCHWEFDFLLQQPGTYKLEAKVLVVNDVTADVRQESILQVLGPSQIKHDNKVPVEQFPFHAGFPGFDMDPRVPASLACAEVCSRVHRCVYWSTPAVEYLKHGGCELYFQPLAKQTPQATHSTPPANASYSASALTAPFSYIFPEMQVVPSESQSFVAGTTSHGPRPSDAKHATMYHVGCGWSFWLIGVSPCLSAELDDAVYLPENHFSFETAPATTNQRERVQTDKQSASRRSQTITSELPLCDIDEHETRDEGRWVKLPYPYHDKCPVRYEENVKEHYDVLRDYRIMENIPDQPACYFRENMTAIAGKCHMNGCALSRAYSWHSELQKLQRFNGKWQNHHCDFLELLDTELQFCLTHRQIVDIQAIGDDEMAPILNDYLKQRLRPLRFFNAFKENTPVTETLNITINTLGISHWMHHGTRDMWMAAFEKTKKLAEEDTVGRERYWVEHMYTSSERHPLATTDRAAVLNEDAASVFPKGKISSYGLSTAFAYDASMEDDGLRIIGPPMKAVVTKLFHYVCKDFWIPGL